MQAVLFLSGRTMGDALGSAGRLLKPSFERLGYKFVEISLLDPAAVSSIGEIAGTDQIALAFSFVAMGSQMEGATSDGHNVNFWQFSRIPFLSIYGDSPAYFFDRHVLPSKQFAALYGYREHYELRKRLPHSPGFCALIPPSVVDPMLRSELDFSAKERGTLVFLKNGNDPERLVVQWKEGLPASTFEMLLELAGEIATQLAADICNDIDSLVCSYFKSKGFDIEEMTNARLFFLAQLDDYARRLKSTLIAQSLLDFPVEVHGFNWDHIDFAGKRASLTPMSDFVASRALIRQSLGVIDMSPNTGSAPHDRVCRAFGAYTLCLTNEQEFFSINIPEHDAFTFRFTAESIQSKVADVISRPKQYVELGAEIASNFRKNLDPDANARFFIDIAAIVRLQNSPRLPGLQEYFGWPVTKA